MVAGFHYGYRLMILQDALRPKHQSEVAWLSLPFFSPARQGRLLYKLQNPLHNQTLLRRFGCQHGVRFRRVVPGLF